MLVLTELQLKEFNEFFDIRQIVNGDVATLDFLRGVQYVVDQVNFLTMNKEDLDNDV